jgi:hypothetical protein
MDVVRTVEEANADVSNSRKKLGDFRTANKNDHAFLVSKLMQNSSHSADQRLRDINAVERHSDGTYYIKEDVLLNKFGPEFVSRCEDLYNEYDFTMIDKDKHREKINTRAKRFDSIINKTTENKKQKKRESKQVSQNFLDSLSREELIALCNKMMPSFIKGVINGSN